MGKPAARVTDMTAHGGLIVAPGAPTVLIGKMPAATLTSMHVCPMVTGVVPHVGGPIILGSTGVLLGSMPAARLGDMGVCVGPPDSIILGCMTVLIGEAGSGSQAGSAGSAAAAAAASTVGPKAIKPFPLIDPPQPATENHVIECEFVDSAGKPVSGVPYRIQDPNKQNLVGASTSHGMAYHGGYAKAGSYEVNVYELKNAKWKKSKVKMGDPAEFSLEVDLPDSETEIQINIFENRGAKEKCIKTLSVPVNGKKAEGSWQPERTDLPGPPEADPTGPEKAPPHEAPTYYFTCHCLGIVAVSERMRLVDTVEIELLDEKNQGVANADYEAHFHSGEVKKGKLDGKGKAKLEDVDPGEVNVLFPKVQNTEKAKEEEKEKEKEREQEKADGGADAGDEVGEEDDEEETEKSTKFLFPLKKKPELSYKTGGRRFKADRIKGVRLHAGCDLIVPAGTEIRAAADGKILDVYNFYKGTFAMEVDHGDFLARYSEIKPQLPPGIKKGHPVKRGQVIAYVGLMTSGSHMLHFELYNKKASGPLTQRDNPPCQRRSDLIDPTPFLDEAEME